ncbi:hypothetical protein PHYSODRAFT_531132, partial [Phytophthora sojae]
YESSGVFHPANSTAKNYTLFCLLQRPSNTKVDAAEFLQGAQVAVERVFNGMFSSELMGPLSGKKSVKPAIADEMEAMFTPGAYQTWLLPKLWTNKGTRIRGSKIKTFTGVHLTGVSMKRITLASYKISDLQQRALGMDLAKLQKQRIEKAMEMTPEEATTMVERLRLSVTFNVALSVKCVEDDGEETVDEGESTFVLCFESLATRPDDVDWRIQKMEMIHPE